MNHQQEFLTFLGSLMEGKLDGNEWERYAVTHYADPVLESARVELVRASIAAGEWVVVPAQLQAVANVLRSRIESIDCREFGS